MNTLIEKRAYQLMNEITKFQEQIYKKRPDLKLNKSIWIMITLTKKKQLKLQMLSEVVRVEVAYCKSIPTLQDRLSFLVGKEKLENATRDTDTRNLFTVELKTPKKIQSKQTKKVRQLQFLF